MRWLAWMRPRPRYVVQRGDLGVPAAAVTPALPVAAAVKVTDLGCGVANVALTDGRGVPLHDRDLFLPEGFWQAAQADKDAVLRSAARDVIVVYGYASTGRWSQPGPGVWVSGITPEPAAAGEDVLPLPDGRPGS
jgi:hypothetical protein